MTRLQLKHVKKYSHQIRCQVISYILATRHRATEVYMLFSVHWCTILGWHQWTPWRVASHPVIIVLCTKLDAECDRQATVVGRLLTTLGDDRRAIAILVLVPRLGKAPARITHVFEDIQISYLFDKYSPASGSFVPINRKFWVQWRYDLGPYALAQSPVHTMTV